MSAHPSMPTSEELPVLGRRPVLCGAAALCLTAVGGCTGYGQGRVTAPAVT
jgi:hypothetical protein